MTAHNPLRDTILQLDRAVPRYTSYPPAPYFRPLQNTETYAEWLGSLSVETPLSLYLHVPFCHEMCWYCGCNTKITKRYKPVESYTDLILKEIALLAKYLPNTAMPVSNIHFGGGSPGMLHADDFKKIIDALHANFQLSQDTDIAIEIDPRGIDKEKTKAYAQNGVTRVSLGSQDFNDHILESVNRAQPFALSERAVKDLRSEGIHNINLDLIYGLPYQTTDTMRYTIDKALSLSPERVSLFGYAHVPWMKKHMRMINEEALPNQGLRFDLFETGANLLEAQGYVPIGIDHFAKPDDDMTTALKEKRLYRNFQGYTTDTGKELIGIGASSIGKLPQGYIQNAPDMPIYKRAIMSGKLPAHKIYKMHGDDPIYAHVIEQIMCYLQVDLNTVKEQFALPPHYFDDALYELEALAQKDILEIKQNTITINPKARTMARLAANIFDQYAPQTPGTQRHARAV